MVAANFQPTVEHPVPKKVKKQTILDKIILDTSSSLYRPKQIFKNYEKIQHNLYNTQ
jgi:hypothetical protein